jgi:prepilin-type N-terminal cleavage/methylation domain-containing protein
VFKDLNSELNNQKGFSLIELMLALVLCSVVLTVGFELLIIGRQINTRTETLLAANSVAFAKVQEYENKTFDSIAVGSPPTYEVEDFSAQLSALSDGLIKSGTAKVYNQFAPNSGSLMKLRVVIDFQYGSRTRKIEYGTYIQMGGVGR